MTGILTEIVSLLTSGLEQMATGIGSGLQKLVTNIFLETTGEGASAVTKLSTFGGIVIIFAGVALAIGLCRWVTNYLTSLGN